MPEDGNLEQDDLVVVRPNGTNDLVEATTYAGTFNLITDDYSG